MTSSSPALPRPTREPLVTRPFMLLVAAHLLQGVGWSSMMLLPRYLEHLGASRATIGSIMAAEAISGLMARPVVGWALDRVGRRPTLIVATLIVTAAMLLIGLTDRIGPLIIGARLLFGVGVGALFTAYFAFAADLVPTSRRTEGIALFGVSGLVPLVINPFSEAVGVAAADLRWFFPVLALVVACSLIPLIALDEPRPAGSAARPGLSVVLRHLVARRLWSSWLATVVFSGLVALFMAFATVTADARGIEAGTAFWLTYAAGAVGVRLLGARLPDRLGTRNLVVPAIAVYVMAAVAMAGAETTSDLLVGGLLGGLGHGYAFPVLTSQVVSRAPSVMRGAALATFTGLWSASSLLLSPLFGLIADRTSDAAMFASAAVASVGVMGIWLVLEHRSGGDLIE